MAKKAFRITLRVLLVIILLLLAFMFALRYPTFQTYLAQKAASYLSGRLNTKVTIGKVRIEFFNKAHFEDFYMEDLNHDTLIATHSLDIRFKIFNLFKREVSISTVRLDNAIVHLHRDSTGTKVNLMELLGGAKNNTAPTATDTSAKKPWNIALRKIVLTNTDFRYLDEKGKLDLKVFLGSLEADIKTFDLNKKLIDISRANLADADVSVDLLKRVKTNNIDTSGYTHFMKGGMQITFNEFTLTNSHFALNDHNVDTILPKGMDFKHLDITGINLYAEKGAVIADTIFADIKLLSATDRSGFALKNLSADARVSVNDITLNHMDIKTESSHITNYLSFNYNHFEDFKKFFSNVKLNADLNGSKLSIKDLNYFVHKLDKISHNTFGISGVITGSIDNLRGRGVEIRTGSNTVFKGDFSTSGLPDLYETSLNLRVKRLATTVSDIQRIYPGLKIPPNINSLGLVYFTGNFDGFLTDFVADGKLSTDIGTANMDVNFKYDKDKNKSAYSGNLALNEFDLGKFFGDEKNLGKVSIDGKIKGGGLTLESLKADLKANVSSITLKGYEYKDIKVDGSVFQKSFTGDLQVRDQYLNVDFSGKVDITGEQPVFNFTADITNAELQRLNITKENIIIGGNLKSNFTGSNIDNIVGDVQLSNVSILRDSIDAYINYLTLDASNLPGGQRKLKLISELAEGEMVGHFNMKELPKALIRFAQKTFTRGYVDTTSFANQQTFNLDVRIFDPRSLPQIFVPKLYDIHNAHITGKFNSSDNEVHVSSYIQQLTYGGFGVNEMDLVANSTNGNIDFKTTVDNVYSGDSLMLDTVSITSNTLENDDIKFNVLAADKRRYNYANITAFLTPQQGRAIVRLDTSDVKLANYNWHFNKDNFTIIEGKKITTNNLIFRSNEQTIYISSYLKDDTATAVKLTLDNTSIADFTGIFTSKLGYLKGSINGKLTIDNVFYKPRVFADFVVEEFMLDNQLIGDINVESKLDEEGKNILINASVKSMVVNNNYNNLTAKGKVSIDPLNPGMDIDVNATHLNLNFLNYSFFDKYVKDVNGYATLNVNVYGTPAKPLLKGDVTLMDDTVTVSFLNTRYHTTGQKVKVDSHGFDVGELILYDVDNNAIYGSGRINHESFKQFALDLKVVTPKAQLLNTNEKLSPNFYGIAYGNANVTFDGPVTNIKIVATATTSRGTWCRLPILTSYETNKYGFYRFVNQGEDTLKAEADKKLKLNGVDFYLKLIATPDARMDIILDPVSGDMLTAYGSGTINLDMKHNENIAMRGIYTIERGDYQFTLQNIVKKHFDLNTGSSINFSGDIYKAALDVDASYSVRASTYNLISDLISNTGTDQTSTGSATASSSPLVSAAKGRADVKLLMKLTGVLEQPNIAFDIKVLNADPQVKSYVEQKLTLLKNNENELNTQVFGILVMSQFLPTNFFNGGGSIGTAAGGTATNTVSEFVSSQLSNYVSNLLDYTSIKNLDINFKYSQYDQASSITQQNGTPTTSFDTRRELQLALEQRLLNNRLVINAGGNLDIGNSTVVDNGAGGQSGSKAVIPTGDFQIEYLLTPDGVWRAKAFNRTNYDYYNSRNNNSTGVGLSYRQEFDKPSELFSKVKEKRKAKKAKKASENAAGDKKPEENVNTPPADDKNKP